VKLFNACEYKTSEALSGDPELVVYDGPLDRMYTRRLKENVLAVTMLILDYDGGMPLQEARERFKYYEYVGYTSFRHLKDKGVEKFRLVFPLTTPIPAAGEFTDCDDLIDGSAWYELTDALKEFAGACDPASFRCNQFYYLPITPRSRVDTAQVWVNSGAVLEWSSWKRTPPQKYVRTTDSASAARRSQTHRLEPNQVLRTQSGAVRVRDVAVRVEGVWCPFHDDKHGTEFIKRIPATGDVFLYCRRCDQTFWMSRGYDDDGSSTDPNGLLVMDKRPRHADFTDAADRTHVNEQLRRIGQLIYREEIPVPLGGRPVEFPTHLVYLPEGSGKSALAFDLAAKGMKILFACKSLEQMFEKYDEFTEKSKQHASREAD